VLSADVPSKKQLRWSEVIFKEKLGLERKPAAIGEEASLDEASRPELAVIKRFALATSLRIEEIVTLSWPQVGWEDREVRLMQKGQHYRTVPLIAGTRRSSARSKAPHKMSTPGDRAAGRHLAVDDEAVPARGNDVEDISRPDLELLRASEAKNRGLLIEIGSRMDEV
jgi:integrase